MGEARFVSSIRFRLAVLYTVVVFSIAALVVGVINFAFSRSLGAEPVTAELLIRRVSSEPGAAVFLDAESLDAIEQLANNRALEELRSMSLLVLAVLVPTSLVAGWFIAGRVLRPVGHIAAVAREIQVSDLSRRIKLQGPDDELKHLADAFDAMLDRVEQGAEDQRRFIQDISHELRNPLATMATSLDVVLADEHAGVDELRGTASLVRRSLDRTTLTVDGLMRFARRELPTAGQSVVQLGVLAQEVVEDFKVPAGRRDIDIRRVGAAGPAVRADREALRSAVANLAGNAVRLAPEGSTVVCGAGVRDEWAWIGVRDEGPGIAETDHRNVFQRNWGKDTSRVRAEQRSGIGLSIVRQVAESVGGTVTLTSSAATGSSFVIWLPLREGVDPGALTFDGIHPIEDPLFGAR
ncbi:MAG TPA: HAMP domain-containing sensor histidine kinase [Acidimicrobiia bacterium]|nr:HAMP domain-containing sensor histidine kinase [Acidimicrobiia bacterium]